MNPNDYEQLLIDFWNEYNEKSGIQYFDTVALGLEPRMYSICCEEIEGEVRLNFKVWNGTTLSLFFQNDDGFFKINTFWDESYQKRYRARDGDFDFKQVNILGKIFNISVALNSQGKPVFLTANLT